MVDILSGAQFDGIILKVGMTNKAVTGDHLRKALIVVFLIVLVVYVTSGYWLSAYGRFLILDETPHQADAIVVISGGETVFRVATGAELYHNGYSSRIIMSGGGRQTLRYTDADLMRMEAEDRGVPSSSILLENKSKSTYDNAVYVKEIVLNNQFKSILLVTSNFHTRRASYIFNKVFEDTEVEITTVAAMDPEFISDSWWKSHEGQQKALTELPNLIVYWLKYR